MSFTIPNWTPFNLTHPRETTYWQNMSYCENPVQDYERVKSKIIKTYIMGDTETGYSFSIPVREDPPPSDKYTLDMYSTECSSEELAGTEAHKERLNGRSAIVGHELPREARCERCRRWPYQCQCQPLQEDNKEDENDADYFTYRLYRTDAELLLHQIRSRSDIDAEVARIFNREIVVETANGSDTVTLDFLFAYSNQILNSFRPFSYETPDIFLTIDEIIAEFDSKSCSDIHSESSFDIDFDGTYEIVSQIDSETSPEIVNEIALDAINA